MQIKRVMQPRSPYNRMNPGLLAVEIDQSFHLRLDVFWRCVLEQRPVRSNHVIGPRLPVAVPQRGLHAIPQRIYRFAGLLVPRDRSVKLANEENSQGSFRSRRVCHELKSVKLAADERERVVIDSPLPFRGFRGEPLGN
jgi:hypothetical protein